MGRFFPPEKISKRTAINVCSVFASCCFAIGFPVPAAHARIFDAPLQYFFSDEYPGYFNNLATADVNCDGHVDAIICSGRDHSLRIMLGRGDGSFETGTRVTCDANIHHHSLGDIDGDGVYDLILVRGPTLYPDDHVIVYLGLGNGSFVPVGEGIDLDGEVARESLLDDLDGDGNLDLVISNGNLNTLTVWLGQGDGTFVETTEIPVSGYAGVMAAGDLNSDGIDDLLVANRNEATLSVLLGQGGGTFSNPEYVPCGDSAEYVIVGDFNDDQILDAAVANESDETVSVLLGTGDGGFHERVAYPVHCRARCVQVGDLDNDGHLDIVLSNYFDRYYAVLFGMGSGAFDDVDQLPAGPGGSYGVPHRFELHDLNDDGSLDLVGAQRYCIVSMLGTGDGSFITAEALPLGASETDEIQHAFLTDINRDSLADLVILNVSSNMLYSLKIYPHHADGHFSEPVRIATPPWGGCLAIEDLDGDRIPDLIFGYPYLGGSQYIRKFTIKMGNGDFSFGEPMPFDTGDVVEAFGFGDWNEDGRLDLVTGHRNESMTIFFGNGDGTFVEGTVYPSAENVREIMVGDVNNDLHLDLLVLGETGYTPVYLGDGSGDFTRLTYSALPQGAAYARLLAVDEDKYLDLVATYHGSGILRVHHGLGNGEFVSAHTYDIDSEARRFFLVDLDRDGELDAVATQPHSYSAAVVTSVDPGMPSDIHNFSLSLMPDRLVVGDLDLDGDDDVACWRFQENEFEVLLNTMADGFSTIYAALGPGPSNEPRVRVCTPQGDYLFTWTAYGTRGFGTNVTTGQLFDDQGEEVITGPGPGPVCGPHVRVFNWRGAPHGGADFIAYGTQRFGVNVAAGDLDGDGYDEVITGPGPGVVFGPHVRGWAFNGTNIASAMPGVNFFAYGTQRWGVNIASGDVDGDLMDEIITGAGPGAVFGPHVRGWNVDGGPAEPTPGISFLAYGSRHFGVRVAAGDLDGDGIDEIITAPGPSPNFGAHIRGWQFDGSIVAPLPGFNFFADSVGVESYGATVFSGTDLDGDGRDELITGAGPGPDLPSRVRVFSYDGTTAYLQHSFQAFPDGWTYGVNVAASGLGNARP